MYWDNENQVAIKPLLLEYGEIYDRKSLSVFLNRSSKKRIIPFYKGQKLRHTSGFSSNYFPDNIKDSILLDDLFHLLIDIYSSNTRDIVKLNRDEVKNIDVIKDKFLKAYKNLLNSIKNKTYDSIKLFDGNIKKNSLFLKFYNLNIDDTWKNFKISDKYTIADILNKDKISTYDMNDVEYLKIVKNEEIEILNSKIFERLMTNRNFRRILHSHGFNIYYVYEYRSSGSLLSKRELDNDLIYRSPEFDEISFSESILENQKFSLDDILIAYIGKLSSIEYRVDLTLNLLPVEDIKGRFSLAIENNELFQFIKIEVSQRDFIVFPFIVIGDNIVEISNEKLYQLFNNIITSKFEDYDKAYSILKGIVIDCAKNTYPDWYKSYLTGKDFKPIDLTHLNELHEPFS